MKKAMFGVLITLLFTACNGNKSNTNSGDSGPNSTNVQNVNGNIPDSTSGIKLDTKGDTTGGKKDTSSH